MASFPVGLPALAHQPFPRMAACPARLVGNLREDAGACARSQVAEAATLKGVREARSRGPEGDLHAWPASWSPRTACSNVHVLQPPSTGLKEIYYPPQIDSKKKFKRRNREKKQAGNGPGESKAAAISTRVQKCFSRVLAALEGRNCVRAEKTLPTLDFFLQKTVAPLGLACRSPPRHFSRG